MVTKTIVSWLERRADEQDRVAAEKRLTARFLEDQRIREIEFTEAVKRRLIDMIKEGVEGVMRLKRDVFQRSSVGVLFTNRSVSVDGRGANRVYGVDGTLKNAGAEHQWRNVHFYRK